MRFFSSISVATAIISQASGFIYPLCSRYGGLCWGEDVTSEGIFDDDATILEWIVNSVVSLFCYILAIFSSITRIYDCARSEGWLFFYQNEEPSFLDSTLNLFGIELASRSKKRKECFYSVYILITWIAFLATFTYCVVAMSRHYRKTKHRPKLSRPKTDIFGRSLSCCECCRHKRL